MTQALQLTSISSMKTSDRHHDKSTHDRSTHCGVNFSGDIHPRKRPSNNMNSTERVLVKLDKIDAVAQEIRSPFQFMDLPVELRCLVYEELLVVGKVFCKGTTMEPLRTKRYHDEAYYRLPDLNILRVCKTIHKEAEPIYLSKNLFVLPRRWYKHKPFSIVDPAVDRTPVSYHPQLFSARGLTCVKNISISFDRSAHDDGLLEAWHKHQASNPPSPEFTLFEFVIPYSKSEANSPPYWRDIFRALIGLALARSRNALPLSPFKYVELDFTDAYGPLDMSRPLSSINLGWIRCLKPEVIDIIGTETVEERRVLKEVMESQASVAMEDIGKLVPAKPIHMSKIEFRDSADSPRWDRWKCHTKQREVRMWGLY